MRTKCPKCKELTLETKTDKDRVHYLCHWYLCDYSHILSLEKTGAPAEYPPMSQMLEEAKNPIIGGGYAGELQRDISNSVEPLALLTSDGSTASYYELPISCSELQHLISHKNMNAQIGEIFRECYRYGQASHCDMLRGAKKIKFYIDAEIARLEQTK